MAKPFSSFVIYGEMRTGSNFLEQNLNQFPDLHVFGELFNPHFIGGANKDELFGISVKDREKEPFQVLDAIKAEDPDIIPGFRFFNDHDPRVLQKTLEDLDCAKVILTRNPLDSYVSRKIAGVTGQWRLTNLKHQKTAMIDFDAAEFGEHIEATQAFQILLLNALQASGQTAYYIHYDDLQSLEILNGLGKFLGSTHQVDGLSQKMKRQNPSALKDKVSNYPQMLKALGEMDFMDLARTPNYEPRRGAGVPKFLLGQATPLLFLPIQSTPIDAVKNWMQAHEKSDDLLTGLNQKELREWQATHPGYQSFTVVRHPLTRAYVAFCERIFSHEKGAYREIRASLIQKYKVGIPKKDADMSGYDLTAHKAAFLAFLKFLKLNLAGQTSLRVDPAWASQTTILQGATKIIVPGHIIHENDLATSLAHLENLLGLKPQKVEIEDPTYQFNLSDIYDTEIENRCRAAYMRDYQNFGFTDWSA